MYIKPIMIIQRIYGKFHDDILYNKWKQSTTLRYYHFQKISTEYNVSDIWENL